MCFRLLFVLCALCLSSLPLTAGIVSFSLTNPSEIFVTGERERQGVAVIDKVTNINGEPTGHFIAEAHQQFKGLGRGNILFMLIGEPKIYLRVGKIEENKFRLYYGDLAVIVPFSLERSGETLYTGVRQDKGVSLIYEVTDKYGNPNGQSIEDAHQQFKKLVKDSVLFMMDGTHRVFLGVDDIIDNKFLFYYGDQKVLPTSQVKDSQDEVPSKQFQRASFSLKNPGEIIYTGVREGKGVVLIDQVTEKNGYATAQTIAEAHQHFKALCRGNILFTLSGEPKIYLRVGKIEDNKFRLYYGDPAVIVPFSLEQSGETLYTGVRLNKGVAQIYEVTDKYGDPTGQSIEDAHQQFENLGKASVLFLLDGTPRVFLGVDDIIDNKFLFYYGDQKVLPTSQVKEVQDKVPLKQGKEATFSLANPAIIYYTGEHQEKGVVLIDKVTDINGKSTGQSIADAYQHFKTLPKKTVLYMLNSKQRKIFLGVCPMKDNKFPLCYGDPEDERVSYTLIDPELRTYKIVYTGQRYTTGHALIDTVEYENGTSAGQSIIEAQKTFSRLPPHSILFLLNGKRKTILEVGAVENNKFLIRYMDEITPESSQK